MKEQFYRKASEASQMPVLGTGVHSVLSSLPCLAPYFVLITVM